MAVDLDAVRGAEAQIQQLQLVACNVTTVEEIAWMRKHPRCLPPARGDPGWSGYAPNDEGSTLANFAVFLRGRRVAAARAARCG